MGEFSLYRGLIRNLTLHLLSQSTSYHWAGLLFLNLFAIIPLLFVCVRITAVFPFFFGKVKASYLLNCFSPTPSFYLKIYA